jgi:hypothetical protein
MRHTGWCSARTVFMSLCAFVLLRTVPAADGMIEPLFRRMLYLYLMAAAASALQHMYEVPVQ